MLSFRKKIFISYLLVFLVFMTLIFPFASTTVKRIVVESMRSRSLELIGKIQSATNNEDLVRQLKSLKSQIFFRVAVISDERKLLYDSHIKRLLGPRFSQEYVVDHPEVEEAFVKGNGYNEDYSDLLSQKFAYMATAFDFHGKTYVMRTAFPYKYVTDLTHDFEMGFLGLSIAVLLLFTVMTWLIIHRLSSPIQQIITDITPYQEGRQTSIPEIHLSRGTSDDFGRLAYTLNSLSARIQSHIDSLTKERNEKQAILESLVEGVIAVDGEGQITYANEMALKLLNKQHQDLIGHRLGAIEQPRCQELLARCQKEGKPLTDAMQVKRDGKRIFLHIVAAPKNQDGAILILQDQSSHYRMIEMRKDFIANASHELKTPITIIRGFAETLHDNPEMPRETVERVTGKIMSNCQRMAAIIHDLLTLADIENIPESRLVDCDLQELVESCRDRLLEAHSDAQIDVVCNENSPRFTADPHLIEVAITNLLENAVKYSNGPAHITVTLTRKENHLQLNVADKGIGIAATDLEHIFQRFYRVDKAHSRKIGGSGLGLSIVETIIDKHMGKVSVQSKVGEGSTFTIFLPANGNRK